ncbi:MAG: hypothetical protein LC775_05485, partial [Acidobacteria bacterium]|nr:hypothetical protein [Acidobacteriota bacterium]
DCAACRLRLLKARCPHRAPERSIGSMLASAKLLLGSIYGSRKAVRRARSVQRGRQPWNTIQSMLERLHRSGICGLLELRNPP